MIMRLWGPATAVIATLALAATAGAQIPEAKCQATKEKCLNKLVSGLITCYSKDSAKPDSIKLTACLQKTTDKFTGGADPTKACFAKAKPPCLTSNDGPTILGGGSGVADSLLNTLDPSALPSTLSKCTSGQYKCVASLAKGILTCDGKNTAKPDSVKLTDCLNKTFAKYTGGSDPTKGCFAKLEARMPNDCVTSGSSVTADTLTQLNLKDVTPQLTCGNNDPNGYGKECDDGNLTNGDGCSFACKLCGNGQTGPGETCDDGNTDPLAFDPCPSNCVIQSCDVNLGTSVLASVNLNTAGLNSVVIGVDYPEGRVIIPGSGPVDSRIQNIQAGASGVSNDLDYALREVIARTAPFSTLSTGLLFKINFENCAGSDPITASCTVLSASDPFGVDVSGATCSLSVP